MQEACQRPCTFTHHLNVKGYKGELLRLTPIILFALPDEHAQGVTLGEIVTMFNRLKSCIGEQIKETFCHHPSLLQSILVQLQRDGFVASSHAQNTFQGARLFSQVRKGAFMQGNQQRSCTICRSMQELIQRLDNVVDTLRHMDSLIVSAGTFHCLQSTLSGMISTIQYSSHYSSWPTKSRETVVIHLEEGLSCLTRSLTSREKQHSCPFASTRKSVSFGNYSF